MSKPILELDTFLLIKLQNMTDKEINDLLDKYNLSYDNKVWGKSQQEIEYE